VRYLLLILSFLVVADFSSGQIWEKLYNPGTKYQPVIALETYDKGLIFCGTDFSDSGNSIIYKTDFNGNILWKRNTNIPGQHVFITGMYLTADGGAVFSAYKYRGNNDNGIILYKIDACGNLQWNKLFVFKQKCYSGQVKVMKDGGFLFDFHYSTFHKESFPPQTVEDFFGAFVRTDNLGNLNWKFFEVGQPTDFFLDNRDNIISCNYDFFTLGSHSIPRSVIYVAKDDSSGNEAWEDISVDYYQYPESICPLAGKGYLTFAYVRDSLASLGFLGTDYDGHHLWTKKITDSTHYLFARNMISLNDSQYLFIAVQYDPIRAEPAMYIVKIDTSIKILKSIVYKNNNYNIDPFSISACSDNSYIISGQMTNKSGDRNIYVTRIKTDLTQDSFSNRPMKYDFLCKSTPDSFGVLDFSKADLIKLYTDQPGYKDGLLVYPNPARDHVKIVFNAVGQGEFLLNIYDAAGKHVLAKKLSPDIDGDLSQEIDIKNIAKGFCIMVMTHNGNTWSKKLVVY
jgi:hypothetical protein